MRLALATAPLLLACACVRPGPAPARTAGGPEEDWEAAWERGRAAFTEAERDGFTMPRCAAATEAFEAVAAMPEAPVTRALTMAGMTWERCGEPGRAVTVLSRAAAEEPGSCPIRVSLGLARLADGRPQEAEADFLQAVRQTPRCVEARLNLAIVQRRRGALDEAAEELQQVLRLDPRSVAALAELAAVYLDQASEDVRMLRRAELVCRQAVEIAPQHAALHNTWGLINAQQGRIVEALGRFERAFDLDPELLSAYLNYGQITLSFRGFEDAERVFRRALTVRPSDYDALIGLGIALRGLGRIDESKEHYELALTLDPERPEAWFNLGVLHQDHMDGTAQSLREAKRFFEAFLAKADQRGRYASAIEEVERCCGGPGPSTDCRPGRLQSINTALALLDHRPVPGCAGDPIPPSN